MGILKRLFGIKDESSGSFVPQTVERLDPDKVSGMFERSPSFSLIAIPIETNCNIPEFLSSCGYTVQKEFTFSGQFAELYFQIAQPFGPNNSIVRKAWYNAEGYIILIDPEMVLVTEIDRLSELATAANNTVKAAIWERVSESVAFVEVGQDGIVRQTWYCEGEPSEPAINEHAEIAANPNDEGLKLALSEYGLADDSVFGFINSNVVELQE